MAASGIVHVRGSGPYCGLDRVDPDMAAIRSDTYDRQGYRHGKRKQPGYH
jgi:hypothetical protein